MSNSNLNPRSWTLLALAVSSLAAACASTSNPPAQEAPPAEGAVQPAADTGELRCGTRGGVQCSETQFCNLEPDSDCGATDRGGKCETKPEACTRDMRPVCGCDYVTHSNPCVAHSVGASIRHDGSCTAADCEQAGGRAVPGIGPPPECAANETQLTWIVPSADTMAMEGMLCCMPKAE
jgi:hypothetical protein